MVSLLLMKSMRKMRLNCAVLLMAIALVGCCEDYYYENADTDYTKVSSHDVSGAISIKDRALGGKIVIPSDKGKDIFVPEKVRLVLLDSSLAATDTLKGSIVKDDAIGYEFSARNYKSPYVKILVKGKWKLYGSKAVSTTFETISDISNEMNPLVDLMTHLEVPLVEALVDEGYPFKAAKQLAMQKFSENFGLKYVNAPAESYEREFVEVGTMYAFLLRGRSDSEFLENIEDFRLDMEDGVLDDTLAMIDFADYAVEDWLRLDSLLRQLNPASDHWNWKLAGRLVERAYGLISCENDSTGKVGKVKAKGSKYKGDSLVCDVAKPGDDYFYRALTPLERELGPCGYRADGKDKFASIGDSLFYVCNYQPIWIDELEDSGSIEKWREASWGVTLNKVLGPCNKEVLKVEGSENEYRSLIRKKLGDTVYVCQYDYLFWKNEGTDSLLYFLGDCGVKNLWSLEKLGDSSEYVCTYDSWVSANDTLKFLSEQRRCDKETDSLRTFSFGSTYYICGDVKWGKDSVYTFKDTTQAYADSLDKVYFFKKECSVLADTVKYYYDSLSSQYYHCEIRNNKIKFYEVEEEKGRTYFCGEFAKTLTGCSAESDTTEVVSCPYNTKETWVNAESDGYYHCSHVDGGYTYVQIPYWEVNYYNSLHESGNLEPCNPQSDTLEYKRDSYGYYYYCVEEGGEWKNELIELDSLKEKLVDEWVKTLEPCNAENARWKRYYKSFLYEKRYVVCDYDMDSNFTLLKVDEPYYSNYPEREYLMKVKPPLEACSEEQMAARGTPVEVVNGSITDPRDGRNYRVVTIGEQTWMAENLGYYDTLAAPNLVNRSDCSKVPTLCSTTGRLYFWDAVVGVPSDFNADTIQTRLCAPVQGICPAGWHVPSVEEWSRLFQYVSYHNNGAGYGGSLKAETGWAVNPRVKDIFGFSVAPVSWTTDASAYFATSEIDASSRIRRNAVIQFTYSSGSPTINEDSMSRSFSVRCVKD